MRRYEIKNITPSLAVVHTMEKQMEAERQKRASITSSTGAKEAKILVSEGEMHELGRIFEGADVSVVPESIAQMRGFFEGVSQVGASTAPAPSASAPPSFPTSNTNR